MECRHNDGCREKKFSNLDEGVDDVILDVSLADEKKKTTESYICASKTFLSSHTATLKAVPGHMCRAPNKAFYMYPL